MSAPDEVVARVREWAEQEETSLSQMYADAVEAYVQEKRRQQAAERVEAILDRTTVQPGHGNCIVPPESDLRLFQSNLADAQTPIPTYIPA